MNWLKRLVDRIPRRAYTVYYYGEIGWTSFDRDIMEEEIRLSEPEDADLYTIKRVWISPARLATYREFEGW